MAHHPSRQIALGHAAVHVALPRHRAVAQHREGIADGQHLAQLVGDEHDGHALAAHGAHHIEHAADLQLGQRGRRLVHDDDSCLKQQCPGDLHNLLVGRVQRAQRHGGIQLHVQPAEHLAGTRRHSFAVEARALLQLAAEEEVFVDVQVVDQIQLLMDERDARVQ